MSSSQAIVNWLNALDQSYFSYWVWCIIMCFIHRLQCTLIIVLLFSNSTLTSCSTFTYVLVLSNSTMMQGWYYVESLTGQRHDRVQTESQIATVDSCFDLVGPLQHGVASCKVFSWSTDIHKPTICRWWWPQMKLKSKSLPISQCRMQNAWKGTVGKIQNIVSLPR